MSDREVSFSSGELTLRGNLAFPEVADAAGDVPAFLVLHGFGSGKDSPNVIDPANLLNSLGYATLRFDMRGCGISDGQRGNIICLEQVEDTQAAFDYLSGVDGIDPTRIGVIGTSFGGAVAVYTAGLDERIAVCISNGGWGNGYTKFRAQHPSADAWSRFQRTRERARQHKRRTGETMMIPRYEIVPVPQHVMDSLADKSVDLWPKDAITEFTAETIESMLDFRAEELVGAIAPRPLLLLHSATDSVTPTEQSISLFERAGQPTELHFFSELDHWMFAENDPRVWSALSAWLDRYFPAAA